MSDMSKEFESAFKSVNKLNEDACTLSENALSVIKGYTDTGSMALNAIISGSLYGGAPSGRIIGFAGPSMSGKTLILNKIIANKLKTDPDAWGVVWDSEAAYDENMIINVGGNPKRMKICPVETVEQCRNEISALLDNIITNPKLHGKVIIGIDSLGNLASQKEINDAKAGKSAVDMGARSKACKSMMRCLTYKAAKADCTIIFSNHIYDDPSSMYPSLVKDQSGGKGPIYLASVLVQLAVSQNKEGVDKISPLANKVSGVNMSAMTVKNRFIPSFLKTSLDLNFVTGLYKYSGLLEMALGYGVITKQGNTYFLGEEKLGFAKKFKRNKDLWENSIIPSLELKLKEHLKYNAVDSDDDFDLIEQEVGEVEADEES